MKKYAVQAYTVCKGGIWGHRRGGGLKQIKHLPQSPFTGQFVKITTFDIAFCQTNLSTNRAYELCYQRRHHIVLNTTTTLLTFVSAALPLRSLVGIIVPLERSAVIGNIQ